MAQWAIALQTNQLINKESLKNIDPSDFKRWCDT
jgi:hypothetical protein